MNKIGIIGGTGISELLLLKKGEERLVTTEFGTIPVQSGRLGGKEIFFLNRHSHGYCPPHQINARGNLMALKMLGVEAIIAIASVGGITSRMKPGTLALLTDFIDFTRDRIQYFDEKKFTDVSFPYDEGLRKKIIRAGKKLGLKIKPRAVYACCAGPRFESRAEIQAYQRLGADVVGMTQVPEVILAAELGIPYAAIAVVTNSAAGITPKKISAGDVNKMMSAKQEVLSKLFKEAFGLIR